MIDIQFDECQFVLIPQSFDAKFTFDEHLCSTQNGLGGYYPLPWVDLSRSSRHIHYIIHPALPPASSHCRSAENTLPAVHTNAFYVGTYLLYASTRRIIFSTVSQLVSRTASVLYRYAFAAYQHGEQDKSLSVLHRRPPASQSKHVTQSGSATAVT